MKLPISRRALRGGLRALLLGFLFAAGSAAAGTMTVYKTATCGCCSAWVEHVRNAGFEVDAVNVSRAELVDHKRRLKLPSALGSCHTAVIDGYVIEGHVPAADIRRLLDESPDVAGLAVPGMPLGSPGMDFDDRTEPYNVVAFDQAGGLSLFAHHGE